MTLFSFPLETSYRSRLLINYGNDHIVNKKLNGDIIPVFEGGVGAYFATRSVSHFRTCLPTHTNTKPKNMRWWERVLVHPRPSLSIRNYHYGEMIRPESKRSDCPKSTGTVPLPVTTQQQNLTFWVTPWA